jgi:hypothetical protein
VTDETFERRCRAVLFAVLAWITLGPMVLLLVYLLTD